MEEAGVSECKQILENELVLLRSMYGSDELSVFGASYDSGYSSDTLINLHLKVEKVNLEVVFQYSCLYPLHSRPSVLVRSNDINATEMNKALRLYIEELNFGDPMTFSIIQWIQDNSSQFLVAKLLPSETCDTESQMWERLWIYSHHLYSVVKRRNIASEAKSLKLKGFFISGKPGIIIVEGTKENCQKFWGTIVKYGWKKLVIRHREQSFEEGFLKLPHFKEVLLTSTDGRSINYADLKKLLTDMGLEYGFQTLLNL